MTGEYRIPDGFLIGCGSSAYQVEGAAFQDGKGESCIDRHCHRCPDWNDDHTNGDIACDSYNKTEEDIKLLKDLGVDFYRFSICWSRIAPNGDCKTKLSKEGIEHYRKFIRGLIKEGITPMVTMFHWDLPQHLQDLGGWTNAVIIDYFVEYARVLFKEYGDLVKHWYTLNEPQLISEFGYGTGDPAGNLFPPGAFTPGIGDYLSQHHQLIAHGKVYHMYQKEFKSLQEGEVGIVVHVFWPVPKTKSDKDVQAAKRSLLFELDSLMHPLVKGDYPPALREIVDKNSEQEGRSKSRLPKFTPEEVQTIKGSFDFLGLNEYTNVLVSDGLNGPQPSQSRDSGIIRETNPEAHTPGVSWLAHEPEGIRNSLNYIRENYGTLPMYISENGCDDPNGTRDIHRIQYIKKYLKAVLDAKNDGCNILGYTYWSFLDSFEWSGGYTSKFGLYEVDFNDPTRRRQPKDSVKFMKEMIKTRIIPA